MHLATQTGSVSTMDPINRPHQHSHATASAAVSEPKPDPAVDPAAEVGWFLRRERERYGCSIEEAARATRINRRYLSAIEEGDLERLPELEDALRYVCTYAEYLGFEPVPLAQHYLGILKSMRGDAVEAPSAPQRSAKIIPFPGVPSSTTGLLASAFVAMSVFGAAAWVVVPGLSGTAPQQPQVQASGTDAGYKLPASDPIVTASTGGDGDSLTPSDRETSRAPETEAAPDDLSGLTEFIQQNVSSSGEPKPAADADSGGERVYGADNAQSRLLLRAKSPVWVRIEDRHGNVVMTKTLMTGDSYRVPDRNDLVVIARDGGALSYIVDGEERGTLGAPGEILVGRSLDIQGLAKTSG